MQKFHIIFSNQDGSIKWSEWVSREVLEKIYYSFDGRSHADPKHCNDFAHLADSVSNLLRACPEESKPEKSKRSRKTGFN